MNVRNFLVYGIGKLIPDSLWLHMKYKQHLGKRGDFMNPQTFNEKMQWLKLNDRNPEYSLMADKYSVKKRVSELIGEQYVIPLLGVWNRAEEVDISGLPDQFVLKTTHDCGGVIVCRDKSRFDYNKMVNSFSARLSKNYYWNCREWPYKNIQPRIIAEEYMEDKKSKVLPVYKILCFNGQPEIIQTIQNDKQPNESIDYFDVNWNLLDLRQNYPNSEIPLSRPEKLTEMIEIARKLSRGTRFIRIDLYSINGDIYFSEYTFYSDAGFAAFVPERWDKKLGDMIQLN